MFRNISVLFLVALCFGCQKNSSSTESATVKAAEIEATQVIMPAPPPGQTVGAVYMSLKNNTAKQYTLLHVSSAAADNIQVHRTIYEDGMMKMRHARHLILPPNEVLKLNPGGYHLMLMGLDKEWKPGESFDVKLEFDGGASIETRVQVQSPGQ